MTISTEWLSYMDSSILNITVTTDNILVSKTNACKIREDTIFHIKVEMDPITHHILSVLPMTACNRISVMEITMPSIL